MILNNKYQFGATPIHLLRNKELSAKAKGLGAWLFSHEKNFHLKKSRIHTFFSDGPDGIRSAWQELVKHGYIIEKGRERNEKGHLGESVYDLNPFGNGLPEDEKTQEKSYVEKSNIGETNIGESHVGEPKLLSISSNSKSSNSKSNSKNIKRGIHTKKFEKPTGPQLMELFIQKGMGRDLAIHTAKLFLAHYESNGWKVGRNPMKNWKGAAAKWFLNWEKDQRPTLDRPPLKRLDI